MAYTPYLVANFKTGLDEEVEPWLLPKDAYSVVKNAYFERGVINKRNGFDIFARFASARGLISAITQANPAVVTQINHGFSTGDTIFISNSLSMTQVNNKEFTITVIGPDTYSLNGIDSTAYTPYAGDAIAWWYQDEPIMGIENFIQPDGTKQLCIFNTKRMGFYDSTISSTIIFSAGGTYDGGAINRFGDYFTGGNANFFWTENYRSSNTITDNKLYITNYVDPIYTWDGVTIAPFTAQYGNSGSATVDRCLFIFAFKQRLLLLSTQEAGSLRPQRARWSQAQNPTVWRDDIPGQGGFVDAPTGEFIIGAAFLKDVIIVQFTNSWWMLRPTSDPALPFRWDKITSNRPVNAPYAAVSYDKSVTGIGQSGIIECNGVEANRIDDKIPNFVFEINQINFPKVFARRYLKENQTWTLYPSENSEISDQVLVLNEQEGNFSKYDLSLSCIGFGKTFLSPAWQDYQAFPGDPSASLPPLVWVAQPGELDFGEETWLSGYFQADFPLFLGGSHDGYIYQLDTGTDDNGTPIETEILSGRWNPYKEQGQKAQLGYIDFLVDSDPKTQVEIQFFTNNNTALYKTQKFNFIPQKNFVGDVSNITQANPAVVTVNKHNLNNNEQVRFYRILGMDSLNGGSFTVTVIDDDNFALNAVDTSAIGPYLGDGVAVKGDFEGFKTWKRVYAGAIGFSHRFKLLHNALNEPMRIHATMAYFRPAGKRIIGQ